MKKFLLFLCAIVLLSLQSKGQTVKDIDGNVYNTVTIGNQVWMKENLKTTHYTNGVIIRNIVSNADWTNDKLVREYCDYNNDTANASIYGRLYTAYVFEDHNKVCPVGWYVPTDNDWTILSNTLGGDSIAQIKLKESGNSHWLNKNQNGINESGFTALPGGYRDHNGDFLSLGYYGYWWTSTDTTVWNHKMFFYRTLYAKNVINFKNYDLPNNGYSIRCIKDTTSSIIGEPPSSFHLFPNPANDALFISSDHNLIGEVEVFNPMGEKVLRQRISSNSASIDISALKTGVYFVIFKNNFGSFQQKFMKL